MNARDWFDLWTRCADRFRLHCTTELALYAYTTSELLRTSQLERATRLAVQAERAHDRAAIAFARLSSAQQMLAELTHESFAERSRRG